MVAGTLNDPLVEIMTSFWPQGSGNMTHYGNYSLLNDIGLLQGAISSIN
jgi:hypothetical protein